MCFSMVIIEVVFLINLLGFKKKFIRYLESSFIRMHLPRIPIYPYLQGLWTELLIALAHMSPLNDPRNPCDPAELAITINATKTTNSLGEFIVF